MLKYFNLEESRHVVLESPIQKDDVKRLRELFEEGRLFWKIEFGRVYSVSLELVELLYGEVFERKKNVSIVTHKNKLNRYLNRLGFKTRFESLIKRDVVEINDVEAILIGGSADSSPKIVEIVKNSSFENVSLIIVQHVEENRVGIFDKILQEYTKSKVGYAKHGEKIAKGGVYVAPSNKHLKVVNGRFHLSDEEKRNFARPSLSISYDSFSNYYKERLLVVHECGYASDGVDRLELLKQNGSRLIIQDPRECKAKPMVQNALNLNLQDYVFDLKNVIEYINFIDRDMDEGSCVEYLLEKILEKYNYDFRLYHQDMIKRRLDVFMIKHEIKNVRDAIGVILFNYTAFKAFFLEISINVTEFFRNPNSFRETVSFLKDEYEKNHNVKIWSAGCSSGKEVYSVAIVLDSLKLLDKSIIYATDFNPVVIEEAKNGVYSLESYEIAKDNFKEIGLTTDLDNYFTINNNYVRVDEKIKDKTLFFQHNLVTDSSFNEFDIIICKNVIIYFDVDLQELVFGLFYDSLKFGGHLVLGESEAMIEKFANKFERISQNGKIFKKVL